MLIVNKAIAYLSTHKKAQYIAVAVLTLFLGYEAFVMGNNIGEFAYMISH